MTIRGCILVLLLPVFLPATRAQMIIGPWQPIFKGVERAVGTNFADATIPRRQVANCVRVDLTDPDVQLFHTPRAPDYVAESRETLSLTVSNFLKNHGLQVACTANFYNSAQGFDPTSAGVSCQVYGLAMSQGDVVSVPDYGPDSNNRWVSMLFTTNKEAFLVLSNGPPGTNTEGIFTAVSGYYPVLTNGVVLSDQALRTAYPDPTIHEVQPRTVFGLSQDRRYFYMMIIDGRQPGYSESALNSESGMWIRQFGAWDAVNMDGGGSTAMYMADCAGNPVALGHSSYIAAWSRERYTGSHLGVYAPPLPAFINDVTATAGSVDATITWQTSAPASTQVEYGTTTNYGTLTTLDPTPVTEHAVTLTNLTPLTRYYFRVLSSVDTNLFTYACVGRPFQTTNFAGGQIFPLTNSWRYSTANLNGVSWTAPDYDDSGWSNGVAALWANDGGSNTNGIPSLGTRLPLNPATGYPFTTYYFRTTFVYSDAVENASLIFSNFLDDGAVFHLNGAEIYRVNLPAAPTPIENGTYASGLMCTDGNRANASCPIVFTLTAAAANLVPGTNTLAIEVHNVAQGSGDVVLQSALYYTLPPPPPPPPFFSNVVAVTGETNAVLTWDTLSNCTSQVFFGPTPALGFETELNANPVNSHAVVVQGLEPKTLYFYRIVCAADTNEYTHEGTFTTGEFYLPLMTFAQSWRYTTNRVTEPDWPDPEFDDSLWEGDGPALLYWEDNGAVRPRSTLLPLGGNGRPFPTYYFRTYFELTNSLAGYAIVLTNYIDDGAVLYLNGTELARIRMSAGPVSYNTFASSCPINACDTTADVPDVLRLSGGVLNRFIEGNNFLAAEVHQVNANSSDIVFGTTIGLVRATASETALRIRRTNDVVCIEWDVPFLTLQQKTSLAGGAWTDVPGPVRFSPYCVTNPPGTTIFYRLRD